MSNTPPRQWPVGAGLFVMSVGILTLEVVQMRILAVQMWYHYAYMVVTMSLLGFAAAGTLVTLLPGLLREPLAPKLAGFSTLFGIAVIAVHLVLSNLGDHVAALAGEGSLFGLAVYDTLLVVPYTLAGLVVTLALSAPGRIHTRYFLNLLGSALGAWVFVATISSLGGERLLVLAALSGPVAALVFLIGAPKGKVFALTLVFLFAGWELFWRADVWLPVEIGVERRQYIQGEHIAQRWTPLARLDVFQRPGSFLIVQDGGAGTAMNSDDSWRPKVLLDPHVLAYVPHLRRMEAGGDAPEVAAIGIGGGADLRVARERGAASILGIEINAGMADITSEYHWYNGDVYHLPNTEVLVGEGRATLRRLDRRFDIIQISGADTYTAGTSGSFVLSESYLYTAEAMADFFDHLKPGGTLGIFRLAQEPPRETLRLFGMALEELRRRGIERPSLHAAVVRHQFAGGTVFSTVPLEAEDIAIYMLASEEPSGTFETLYVPGLDPDSNAYTRLAYAIDEGAEDAFHAAYPFDVTPPTDDAPFYFDVHRWSSLWDPPTAAPSVELGPDVPAAPILLTGLLVQVTVLVAALVLLPLWWLRRGGLRVDGAGRQLAYFAGLGVAFMFLEISTIQRLVLFLGHPTYSVSVTLFCFLLFAGLGSWASGRWMADPTRVLRRVVFALVGVIGLFTVLLGPILDAFLGLELDQRIGVAIALLALPTFLMGMPFPLGLHRLKTLQPRLVPWALGVNGGASVIGSVACVIVAMELGFTAVAIAAALIYLAAVLLATTGPLAPTNARTTDGGSAGPAFSPRPGAGPSSPRAGA